MPLSRRNNDNSLFEFEFLDDPTLGPWEKLGLVGVEIAVFIFLLGLICLFA